MKRIEVDQRNPHGFQLFVMESKEPCRMCGKTGCVAMLAAVAGTPETCQLAMTRVGNRDATAFANAMLDIMPKRIICANCGRDEAINWHYIEDPYVLPDGTVIREEPTPYEWMDQYESEKGAGS